MSTEPLCRCQPELAGDYGGGPSRIANIILILASVPLISTIGVVTNVISFIIYTNKAHHSVSANRYLAALAGSDLFICLAGIFVIAADSVRSYNERADQLYVLFLPTLAPLVLVSQMLSVYLVVIAAIDCYISVSPTLAHWRPYYCQPKTANRLIFGLVVLCFAYNLVVFLELETVSCFESSINATRFELCPTALRLSDEYVEIYRGYMYAAVMAFMPFVLLCALTIAILMTLKMSKDVVSSDGDDSESRPIVLVMVVLMFLACNIVSLGVNILDMLKPHVVFSPEAQSIFIDIGNVLVIVNATANFFIYVAYSRSYRQSLTDIFQMSLISKRRWRRGNHFRITSRIDSIELESSHFKPESNNSSTVLVAEQHDCVV